MVSPTATEDERADAERVDQSSPPQRNHSTAEARSHSSSSSLDPYYFGMGEGQSPVDSPILPPPLPTSTSFLHPATPETTEPAVFEPITPGRDPAAIDRRMLVGVGELATPRWARSVNHERPSSNNDSPLDVVPEQSDDREQDSPDSPWTIEAMDGEEISEREEIVRTQSPPPAKTLRKRASAADESGGEEILYPRQSQLPPPPAPLPQLPPQQGSPTGGMLERRSSTNSAPGGAGPNPPSSFSTTTRRARKRSSDEFERDSAGSLVSKHPSLTSVPSSAGMAPKEKDRRKHRSMIVSSTTSTSSSSNGRPRDRRRESIGLASSGSLHHSSTQSLSGVAPRSSRDRHARQTSASSSSDALHHQRRAQTTDYSHLPPSPSSSSIQQYLRQPARPGSPSSPQASQPASTVVAHSLLRGTQEGWSGMDDESTASMLRKLDGLSGKGARARASVGSLSSRNGSPSRRHSSGFQWEGIESIKKAKRSDVDLGASSSDGKESERALAQRKLTGLGISTPEETPFDGSAQSFASAMASSDETPIPVPANATPKKAGSSNTRMSFTPKRTSGSSTIYTASTPTTTTSSRDSTSLSTTTSNTSISATSSGRHSATVTKSTKRSSAGSDTSSVHSSDGTSFKDRVASLASGSGTDELEEFGGVPPVPPLPKDLSSYKSPPPTANTLQFPAHTPQGEEKRKQSLDSPNRYDAPRVTTTAPSAPSTPARQPSQNYQSPSSNSGNVSTSDSSQAQQIHKTPSKKWSFSNALNIKLSSSSGGSPSGSSHRKSIISSSSPRSSVSNTLRKSTSKESPLSPGSGSASGGGNGNARWSPSHTDAMSSAASLASMSSTGGSPGMGSGSGKERGPLSPSSASVHKHSSKRLTPSSIPFFRRSSSQSMQLPTPSANTSYSIHSPNSSSDKLSGGGAEDSYARYPSSSVSTATTGGTREKKNSVLSLGLPSLLKGSSSRRSLHSDKEGKEGGSKSGKEKSGEKSDGKKSGDEKSEGGRLSVLMGRKRGKTLSSTDPGRPKPPVVLPPMQITALNPATAQRVASLKSSSNSLSTPSTPTSTSSGGSIKSSSRLTSQTVSSMQKQSDSSLRSSRNQLPTIAGSPSVSIASHHGAHSKESTMTSSSLPKETPTKIPRISSRTSTAPSPTVKGSASAIPRGRVSAAGNMNTTNPSSLNPSPSTTVSANEFGVMDHNAEDSTPKATAVGSRASLRTSPSSSVTRPVGTRQVSAPAAASSSGSMLRKSTRESMGFPTPRKSSTGPPPPADSSTSHHRFSALSPSKGLKLLSPKISLSSSRLTSNAASSSRQSMSSPSGSSHSLSMAAPAVPYVDDDEVLGDKEMMNCIRKQQAKKMAAGATQEELDNMMKFPEPIPPGTPISPQDLLAGPQSAHLCEYEKEEVLDYPSVYYYGAKSKKKQARPDVSTNNFGYDDDRGDYLVVNRDHLAYRYEIVDTLGKGSFGQVLHCRDHCTGQSTAIKIIRNKKRFHHQALVEIKILDNLRKWDPDEQHYVIKMTDHFYFRNHLCIAMELLSINLYELIKANGFVGFSTTLIKRFTSQILLSLVLMRQHRVVHCDLKPENVLLRHPAKSGLKVIDFGSSCFEHEKIYTYIQSRFYRSPEVILGMNYHMAIDMWSLGCILAELYTGFPIFPGENEQEQLSCIMEVLGVPDKDFVNKSSRKRLFFEPNGAPRAVVNSKGRRRRPGTKSLAQVLRSNDEEFVDFIAKCLCWDPERRLKPQAALKHPFVAQSRHVRPSASASTSKSLLSSSTLSGSRSKLAPETPKKSQIGAPAPLTARSARTTGLPSTPGSSHSSTLPTSTRSYRGTQSQSYGSSRVGVTASAK